MFERLQKLKALFGAEAALRARDKVLKALQAEELKLRELVIRRVESERALVSAETAEALGEAADPSGARRVLSEALAAIERQKLVLGGLRARLVSQTTEIEGQRLAVKAAIPEHVERVRADLVDEWAKGAAAFAALLGKRQAIEALIGQLTELPAPRPAAVDLPADVAAPWQMLERLGAAIDEVTAWGQMAIWPDVDALRPGGLRPYDPSAVYVLSRAYGERCSGEFIVEASLAPGMLFHLVQIGDAVSMGASEWATALEAGRQASLTAKQEEAASAERERAARDLGRLKSGEASGRLAEKGPQETYLQRGAYLPDQYERARLAVKG
jgi:hypothetical protein